MALKSGALVIRKYITAFDVPPINKNSDVILFFLGSNQLDPIKNRLVTVIMAPHAHMGSMLCIA